MISSEVQRTLVKSPPELWAEISDPESLARHLNQFGEIRITRVHPEQKVEWEAGDASGTVVIKPSGWGTKVKLTVTRELAPERAVAAEADADADAEDRLEPDDASTEPRASVELAPAPQSAPETAELPPEPEPEPHLELDAHAEPDLHSECDLHSEPEPPSEPEPRRGFFARLFGRRRPSKPASAPNAECESAPPIAFELKPERPEPEPESESESAPTAERATEPRPTATLAEPGGADEANRRDVAAELATATATAESVAAELAAEDIAAEEVETALTSVLDRLGAAHHRPFSRS